MAQGCKFLRVYKHFAGMESRRFKLDVYSLDHSCFAELGATTFDQLATL
jgi:hypothetical protein